LLRRLGILLLTGAIFAQEYRGRVQGFVSDPSGAVIPGASLVLKNDDTGVDITHLTNARAVIFSIKSIREGTP